MSAAPPHPSALPPAALMGFEGETVTICVCCPDKVSADRWAFSRKYEVVHGICPFCCKQKFGIEGPLLPAP